MATLTEIIYEPEHYNRNCGCTIPAGWVGIIDLDDPLSPISTTQIMGESRKDVIDAAESEGIAICL